MLPSEQLVVGLVRAPCHRDADDIAARRLICGGGPPVPDVRARTRLIHAALASCNEPIAALPVGLCHRTDRIEGMGESDRTSEDVVVEPIRVLWLIKGLGPGGAEQLLVSHSRVGDHERFAYEVAYVVPWKDQMVSRLVANDVAVRCIGRGRRGGLVWPFQVMRLVRSGEFDIVHSHSPLLAVAARLSSLTRSAARRPVIVSTEHNVWKRYSRPTRWANAVTSPFDQRRWAVSKRVAESTRGWAAKTTEVLVHGVVHEDLVSSPGARSRIRGELHLSDDVPIVITVANLREQKDYPTLLEAAHLVIAEDDRAVFLAVGQGALEGEIKALHATLDLGERFRLLGYRQDVPDLLNSADIFVLASQYEGYPIAVMEALTVGLPVVSTSVGGVPDTITEGVEGLLVRSEDPSALAKAILRLLADPERRQDMSVAAIEAGSRFDIRSAVHEQEHAYVSLAKGL